MIYAITQALAAALKAQSVPFPVLHVFGSEPADSVHAARERIVVEEPIGLRRDLVMPSLVRTTSLRCVDSATIRIFARSPLANATGHDHIDRARHVRQHIIAELDVIVRGKRNVLTWGAGGPVALRDSEGSSTWSGAVYELDFAVDRAVPRENWSGERPDEVVIGVDVDLVTIVKVSTALPPAGTPPANAETASGG